MIHSAIHGARHDVHCVLHTHTRDGVVVSAQKDGLLPLSQQSIFSLWPGFLRKLDRVNLGYAE